MPCEVYLDVRELECDQLRPARMGRVGAMPRWERTGQRRMIEQRFVVLQNDFVRAEIAIDLGGRLWRLIDRVRGGDVLGSPESVPVHDGEPWGAAVRHGIVFRVSGEFGGAALGPVTFRIHEPTDEGEAASVVLFALEAGTPLSWHLSYDLQPEEGAVRVAQRAFNRDLGWTETWSGWRVHGARQGLRTVDAAILRTSHGHLVASGDLGGFDISEDEDGVQAIRHGGDLFEPRASDSWEISLWPVAVTEPLNVAGAGLAGCLGDAALEAFASRTFEGTKLVVQTRDHGALEAPITVGPGQPVRVDHAVFPSPPVAFSVMAGGAVLLGSTPSVGVADPRLPAASASIDFRTASNEQLRGAARHRSMRHPAHLALAHAALRQNRLDVAATLVDDALLYDSEDPLAWWLRAAVARLANDGNHIGEAALANAHYLAPLEPLLRAEALLASPVVEGSGPNPLLEPLADDPDALIEVACQLLDAGMDESAARWIDEARRHVDLPMLRVLLADLLLRQSRFEVEAAQWVASLNGQTLTPPYPWRRAEREAVERLRSRFPDSEPLLALEAMW